MRSKIGVRLAAVLAATTLIVAGCSSAGSSSTGSDSQAGEASVELTFWTWAPNMDKVADVWNAAHPNIHVTVNKQDGGDAAVTKLLTAIKAGSGAPDMMQAEYQKIPTLVAANALTDLSKNGAGDLKSHFPDGIWNSVNLGTDAVYAVPQDSAPMAFFYREDVFQQLGLKVPTTWEEYAKVATELHQMDPARYLGTFSANDAGWFTGLAQQAGASWWSIEGDAWSVNINDPATKKVAQYWGDLVERGVIDNKPMYTPEWESSLNNGTQVGWVSAIWAPGVLAGNAGDTAGKWRMTALPQWDSSSAVTGAWGGSATGVTTQSKHAKEAMAFITWMNTTQEGVNALVKNAAIYPADTAAQKEALTAPPDFFANQSDFYALASQISQTMKPFTFGPNVNVAYSAYNDEFGKAAEKKSAIAFTQAVDSMQQITLEDLKNSGFSVK